jgi:hypothetical protein
MPVALNPQSTNVPVSDDQILNGPRRCSSAEVRLQEGETVENALRRIKRQVIQENIIGKSRGTLLLEAGSETPRQAVIGP